MGQLTPSRAIRGSKAAGVALLALLSGCGATRKDPPQAAEAGAGSGGAAQSGGASSGGAAAGGRLSDAGAGAVEAGNIGLPPDDRPKRPTWEPPFPIGDGGWRESTEPLCQTQQGLQRAFDVWADARGVFSLVSVGCNPLAGVLCGNEGVALQFNDGSGWKPIFVVPPGAPSTELNRLTGFANGPVVVSGTYEGKTGPLFIDDAVSFQTDASDASRPFVVNADLAYASREDAVLRYASGSWGEHAALPSPVQALWANEKVVVAVGANQTFLIKSADQAEFLALSEVPAGDYTAVWGFSETDVWAGDRAGRLVHYDGSDFTVIHTGITDTTGDGIVNLWGSQGQLFFLTWTEFGRYDGKGVEILLGPPPGADLARPRITTGGLWGLSPKEVFLTVSDREFRKYACGQYFALWFDGEVFHPF